MCPIRNQVVALEKQSFEKVSHTRSRMREFANLIRMDDALWNERTLRSRGNRALIMQTKVNGGVTLFIRISPL